MTPKEKDTSIPHQNIWKKHFDSCGEDAHVGGARFCVGLVQGLLFRVIILTPTHVLLNKCLVHIVTIIGSDRIFLALFHVHLILLMPVRLMEILRLCLSPHEGAPRCGKRALWTA